MPFFHRNQIVLAFHIEHKVNTYTAKPRNKQPQGVWIWRYKVFNWIPK